MQSVTENVEDLVRVMSSFPEVDDDLFRRMTSPAIISALHSKLAVVSVTVRFDHIAFWKEVYGSMGLSTKEAENTKAYVLAVAAVEFCNHFLRNFVTDLSVFLEEEARQCHDTFRHIGVFKGLSENGWREIVIVYIELRIMKMFLKKMNQRCTEFSTALFIGMRSSQAGGTPSKKVQCLRNVNKYVREKTSFTCRQRKDENFVLKSRTIKVRDYINTVPEKVPSRVSKGKGKAYKAELQVAVKIKKEGNLKRQKKVSSDASVRMALGCEGAEEYSSLMLSTSYNCPTEARRLCVCRYDICRVSRTSEHSAQRDSRLHVARQIAVTQPAIDSQPLPSVADALDEEEMDMSFLDDLSVMASLENVDNTVQTNAGALGCESDGEYTSLILPTSYYYKSVSPIPPYLMTNPLACEDGIADEDIAELLNLFDEEIEQPKSVSI